MTEQREYKMASTMEALIKYLTSVGEKSYEDAGV